jgi:transcriptional regulator of arginine metabolism
LEYPLPGPDRAAVRRAALRKILSTQSVASQEELRLRLAEEGHRVTQTTISRDLAAVGAGKDPGSGDYTLPAAAPAAGLATLAERMRLFVLSVEASGNLAVLKTPPGSAHSVAFALDDVSTDVLPEVLGTIAGDDTVFVASRPPTDGNALTARLLSVMESGR